MSRRRTCRTPVKILNAKGNGDGAAWSTAARRVRSTSRLRRRSFAPSRQRDRHGAEGARSKWAAQRVSHAICVWPRIIAATVTRSMVMSSSEQVVSHPPRRTNQSNDADRYRSRSSSMTSVAPKAPNVTVWQLGDSHCGGCEAAPATTNHRQCREGDEDSSEPTADV